MDIGVGEKMDKKLSNNNNQFKESRWNLLSYFTKHRNIWY